jgi:hypothetical protein
MIFVMDYPFTFLDQLCITLKVVCGYVPSVGGQVCVHAHSVGDQVHVPTRCVGGPVRVPTHCVYGWLNNQDLITLLCKLFSYTAANLHLCSFTRLSVVSVNNMASALLNSRSSLHCAN